MFSDKAPGQLSPKAFQELKQIAREEFGDTMSEDEITDIGLRLLRLFKLLGQETRSEQMVISHQEFDALKYLGEAIHYEKRPPSVRDLSEAMGFRSSRSGFRLFRRLMRRGLIHRDMNGALHLLYEV